MSKDENEDELAEILRDKEFLNEQYDVLVSRYAALELDLDELKNEKEVETIKSAKYEELIKQQESDMEILRSQVEVAQREAEKQAKAISSANQDSKNLPSKTEAELKRKNQELEKRLKSQSDELQTITGEVGRYFPYQFGNFALAQENDKKTSRSDETGRVRGWKGCW